jgi:hypothetical protein
MASAVSDGATASNIASDVSGRTTTKSPSAASTRTSAIVSLRRVVTPATAFLSAVRRFATCSATSASVKPNSAARRHSCSTSASASFHAPSFATAPIVT